MKLYYCVAMFMFLSYHSQLCTPFDFSGLLDLFENSKWRNLKGLKVLGKYLTDEGVKRNEEDGSAVRPNITYLQSLIFCSFYADLTDASVFQGFLHLASLKRLQVCPKPKFGLEAQIALSRRNINLMGIGEDIEGDD